MWEIEVGYPISSIDQLANDYTIGAIIEKYGVLDIITDTKEKDFYLERIPDPSVFCEICKIIKNYLK